MKKVLVLSLLFLGIVGSIGYVINFYPFHDSFSQYIENGEVITLEAKYTPEKIINDHRQELVIDEAHTLQNPILKFYPYLLMDVKYVHADQKPREGLLLWSQVDGEMVLDTNTWETSHGFEDCLLVKATKEDFSILNILAKYGGTTTYDQIAKELQLESTTFNTYLQKVIDKHLVIRKGNYLFLHWENPKIIVSPQTRFKQNLVKKPYNQVQAISRKYSRSD